jgi:hypothetical protein
MKQYTKKQPLAAPRNSGARATRVSGISLYPSQLAILNQGANRLGMSRSRFVQILLEVEDREGIMRRELSRRLALPAPEPVAEAA